MSEYAKPDPPDPDGNQIEQATISSGTDNPIFRTASTLSADPAQSSAAIEKKDWRLDPKCSEDNEIPEVAGLLLLCLICLSSVAVYLRLIKLESWNSQVGTRWFFERAVDEN